MEKKVERKEQIKGWTKRERVSFFLSCLRRRWRGGGRRLWCIVCDRARSDSTDLTL